MRKAAAALAFALLLAGCDRGKKKPEADPIPDPRLDQVAALVKSLEARAAELSDRDTGWFAKDCDGFAWEGERQAARLSDGGVLLKAQLEPGKFDRRPEHGCDYTWSRDMAVIGLFPWAWLHQRRDVLEEHARYGESHAWKMGDPLGDARTVYVPAEIGVLRKMIVALGGAENKVESAWPDVYPKGLDDFEANLQVMGIWLRGEVAAGAATWDDCPNAKAPEGSISKTMFDRLKEHAEREPQNAKYQAIYAKYTGDFTRAIDDVLDPEGIGTYVRCDGGEACAIAERLFAARVILRKFGADQGVFSFQVMRPDWASIF